MNNKNTKSVKVEKINTYYGTDINTITNSYKGVAINKGNNTTGKKDDGSYLKNSLNPNDQPSTKPPMPRSKK